MGSEPIGPHRAGLMEVALFRTVRILNQGSQSSSELVGGTCGLLSNNPERGIRIDMPKTESGEDVGDQGKRSRKNGNQETEESRKRQNLVNKWRSCTIT